MIRGRRADDARRKPDAASLLAGLAALSGGLRLLAVAFDATGYRVGRDLEDLLMCLALLFLGLALWRWRGR